MKRDMKEDTVERKWEKQGRKDRKHETIALSKHQIEQTHIAANQHKCKKRLQNTTQTGE